MAVDIDQAMAALGSSSPAEKSEPAQAAEPSATPSQETATATENKDSSGSAEPKAPASETVAKDQQNDRLPKSAMAFQKLKADLNRKLKNRDEGISKLTEALAKFSGLSFDRQNGDIESYVNAVMQKRDLEASKANLEDNTELDAMREQIRDYQAAEVYGHDEKAMKAYNAQIKPQRPALYKKLGEMDKSGAVVQYLNASAKAPLLEAAFLSPKGMELFEANVTDDPYVTKRNLEKLENEMFNAVNASKQKQQTQPAPVSTPSVNDGNAVTQTNTGPSLADVARWY